MIGLLPLSIGRNIGKAVGEAMLWFPNYNRQVTITNIRHCFPDKTPTERRQLVRRSLHSTGALFFEVAMVWQKPWVWLDKKIVRVEGRELVDQALASDKGLMILAPHLGNWEVIGQYLSQVAPMLNLYEPPPEPALDELMQRARCKTGGLLAPTNQRGVAALLKHLRKGDIVGILPDQVPDSRESGGVYAPFFGQTAYTMTLASQLIKKTQCEVLLSVAVRVQEGFHLKFLPIDQGIYDDDEIISATVINQAVEEIVKQIPEQYQWEYKRFKRLPKGTSKIY